MRFLQELAECSDISYKPSLILRESGPFCGESSVDERDPLFKMQNLRRRILQGAQMLPTPVHHHPRR